MRVRDFVKKLLEYDQNLDLILACDKCACEYDYLSPDQVYFHIHTDIDDDPIQLIVDIDKGMN